MNIQRLGLVLLLSSPLSFAENTALKWALPEPTAALLAEMLSGQAPLKARLAREGNLAGKVQCEIRAEIPLRRDARREAGEESAVECQDERGALIRLSLAGEKVETWGNSFDYAFEMRGALTRLLTEALKDRSLMAGTLEADTICDPAFNYCIESFGLPEELKSRYPFEPISCARTSQYSAAAFETFKKKELSQEAYYYYLQQPGADGWLDRQFRSGVRVQVDESCRFAR